MPVVLGIDPGSLFTGFALLRYAPGGCDIGVLTAGRIPLKAATLAERLSVLLWIVDVPRINASPIFSNMIVYLNGVCNMIRAPLPLDSYMC